MVGSAESLVGKVLLEQGLGKYVDAEFIRTTSREMQEAMDMTPEEMDRAAHALLMLHEEDPAGRRPSRALSGAAARSGGSSMPLTLALTTVLSDVDQQPENANKNRHHKS